MAPQLRGNAKGFAKPALGLGGCRLDHALARQLSTDPHQSAGPALGSSDKGILRSGPYAARQPACVSVDLYCRTTVVPMITAFGCPMKHVGHVPKE
jgi:hypothetical protein